MRQSTMFRHMALCLIFTFASATSIAQGPKRSLAVKVAVVEKDVFSDRAEALGTLRANESVSLTVNVTETITAIHFVDGQEVKKNDVLVEMTSAEESALLVEAQTNAREAKQQLDRIAQLVKAGTASESLLDQRQRDYDAANARLIATQSRLKDRIVKAPFSGVVGLRDVSLGALVRPGDIITTLTDNSKMKLDFDVPSVFLPLLESQLPIVATSRAYRDQAFNGIVSSIDNQVDAVTRTITVRAILPNDDQRLKQGMLMNVELLMNQRESLVIPEEALLPQGEDNFVMLVVPQGDQYVAERRKVSVASRRFGEVEVLNGLEEGDKVITHGGFKVKPGGLVTILPGDDKQAALVSIKE